MISWTSGSRPTRSRRRCRRPGSSARSRASARRARPTCCSITTWARSTARSGRGACRAAARARISEAIASAAREAGAEIRTEAPVARDPHPRRRGRAGVVLESGEEIGARHVLSTVDARRTFLGPARAGHPRAVVRGGRRAGSVTAARPARSTWPSTRCRRSRRCRGRASTCAARSRSRRRRSGWSAPTTTRRRAASAARPYIDIVIPTLVDPSMAPPGKHVMSCFVQYAPYELAPELGGPAGWDRQREAFGDTVVDTIAEFAPNIRDVVVGRQVLTPLDIERDDGPHRGQHLPGRAVARAAVLQPARARLGAIPDADRRALAVRLGGASRRRDHGRTGSPGRARGARRPRRSARQAEPVGRRLAGRRVEVAARPSASPPGRPPPRDGWDAIVVGGGHNGLVAAALLARAGLATLVVEARERARRCGRHHGARARRPRPDARPHRRAGCDRRWSRTLRLREHGLRARRAGHRGVRAATPTARRSPSGAIPRAPPTASGIDPGRRRRRSSPSTRRIRRAGRRPRRARSDDAARPAPPRGGRRAGRPPPGSGAGAASGGPDVQQLIRVLADGRRRPRRGHVRARRHCAPSIARAAASSTWRWARVRPARRPCCCGQRRQRRRRGGPDRVRARRPGRACRMRSRLPPGRPASRSGPARASPASPPTTAARRASSWPTASRSRAPIVVAAIEPKRLLTGLVDPMDAGPDAALAGRQLPHAGRGRQGQPRAGAAAALRRRRRRARRGLLRGRIVLASSVDALDRAFDASKYGEISRAPHIEATIPSLVDPGLVDERGSRRGVQHVLSAIVQYAPYGLADGALGRPARRARRPRRPHARDVRARASRRSWSRARSSRRSTSSASTA